MRQRRPETAEGEHGEADQGLGGLKAEGTPRDEAELRVHALDAGVGQAIGERGLDQWGLFSLAIPDTARLLVVGEILWVLAERA